MDIQITNIILFFIALLIAMSFHEAMHAFTAHWLGDDTAHSLGRVSLNPLRHIDLFTTVLLPVILALLHLPIIMAAKPVPFNPDRVRYGEFGAVLVGIAGPFTNLLLAAVTASILRFASLGIDSAVVSFLITFLQVNVGLFVFNMLPIPPLDGSRVLYAVAPDPVRDVMNRIESAGLVPMLLIFVILIQPLSQLLNAANSTILRLLLY